VIGQVFSSADAVPMQSPHSFALYCFRLQEGGSCPGVFAFNATTTVLTDIRTAPRQRD